MIQTSAKELCNAGPFGSALRWVDFSECFQIECSENFLKFFLSTTLEILDNQSVQSEQTGIFVRFLIIFLESSISTREPS